jgi:hypothetical protein
MSARTPAGDVLARAEELVLRGHRSASYGPPVEAMRRVAASWTVMDGTACTGRDVALKLAALKLAREAHRHDVDNLIDAAGYILIAALCAEAEAEGEG